MADILRVSTSTSCYDYIGNNNIDKNGNVTNMGKMSKTTTMPTNVHFIGKVTNFKENGYFYYKITDCTQKRFKGLYISSRNVIHRPTNAYLNKIYQAKPNTKYYINSSFNQYMPYIDEWGLLYFKAFGKCYKTPINSVALSQKIKLEKYMISPRNEVKINLNHVRVTATGYIIWPSESNVLETEAHRNKKNAEAEKKRKNKQEQNRINNISNKYTYYFKNGQIYTYSTNGKRSSKKTSVSMYTALRVLDQSYTINNGAKSIVLRTITSPQTYLNMKVSESDLTALPPPKKQKNNTPSSSSSSKTNTTNANKSGSKCPYSKPTTTLRIGSTGNGVRWVQWQLNKYGYNLSIDGSFGPATKSAVLAFQKSKRLTRDGIVGPKTISALL